MQKIPCLFERDFSVKPPTLLDRVTSGCEWVTAGEGIATVKWDGTACMIQDSILYKRYDAKSGKTPPGDFMPAQPEPDPVTGHWPGWLLVRNDPADQWHRDAFFRMTVIDARLPFNGTYELMGPKINGNPEKYLYHVLLRHGAGVVDRMTRPPSIRNFEAIREYLQYAGIEGLVFHHPDGRMAKIRRKDYGFEWPVK